MTEVKVVGPPWYRPALVIAWRRDAASSPLEYQSFSIAYRRANADAPWVEHRVSGALGLTVPVSDAHDLEGDWEARVRVADGAKRLVWSPVLSSATPPSGWAGGADRSPVEPEGGSSRDHEAEVTVQIQKPDEAPGPEQRSVPVLESFTANRSGAVLTLKAIWGRPTEEHVSDLPTFVVNVRSAGTAERWQEFRTSSTTWIRVESRSFYLQSEAYEARVCIDEPVRRWSRTLRSLSPGSVQPSTPARGATGSAPSGRPEATHAQAASVPTRRELRALQKLVTSEPVEENPFDEALTKLAEVTESLGQALDQLRTMQSMNDALLAEVVLLRQKVADQEVMMVDEAPPQAASDFSSSATGSWTLRLLSSPTYRAQEERAGRRAPSREAAMAVLEALEDAGGRLSGVSFSSRVPPAVNVRTTLAALRSVLNRDGYGVLTIGDDGTVILDQILASQQFGVGP